MNIGLCLYYSSFLTDPGFDDLILTFELKKKEREREKIFLLINKYEKWGCYWRKKKNLSSKEMFI